MSELEAENLFVNPGLSGEVDEHGLPEGCSVAPYDHGVHYWKVDSRVTANFVRLPDATPSGSPASVG